MLVDDIIIKYVCDGQCSLFAQIVDDSQKNTNYNYEMISQYLEIAKDDYCKMNQVVVISDLSSFNFVKASVITNLSKPTLLATISCAKALNFLGPKHILSTK